MAFKPHIIHYTGHGVFDPERGRMLTLENGNDEWCNVPGEEFAVHLAGREYIRLVILSGCQTAKVKDTDSFSSVSGALIEKGIPAVVAMSQSIRDDSANIFASRFYKGIANGQSVDTALGEARISMSMPRKSRIKEGEMTLPSLDWGIPVIISSVSDLGLFKRLRPPSKKASPKPRGLSRILLPNPGDIFVGRQIDQRKIIRGLRSGNTRCIKILGPGGIGKSSLAALIIEEAEEQFYAVLTVKCTSSLSVGEMMVEINNFLKLNKDDRFDRVMQESVDISEKIEYLIGVLNSSDHRYMIVLDNFEDMLDMESEPHKIKEDSVRSLLETLTLGLKKSKIIITSKIDFPLIEGDRCQAFILSVKLEDLSPVETFRLVEYVPSLKVATLPEKEAITKISGGNPYLLDLIAKAAESEPVENVLEDIKKIEEEFVERTLLGKLYNYLPDEKTKRHFRRASIYKRPVTFNFLEAMGGTPKQIGSLLQKSLLQRVSEDLYDMHSNTRNFGLKLLESVDGAPEVKNVKITAADTYFKSGYEKKDTQHLLESRQFYYEAAEYDRAGELVQDLTEPLRRWGFIGLVRRLNEETEGTA
ncbi:MAG: CHAT domain-containing protein [Halobacteriota archaeon]|nr:CHAT domain-containing protein [Halobacteriota archaeon]